MLDEQGKASFTFRISTARIAPLSSRTFLTLLATTGTCSIHTRFAVPDEEPKDWFPTRIPDDEQRKSYATIRVLA